MADEKATWQNAYNATVENTRRAEAKLRKCRRENQTLRTALVEMIEEQPFPLYGRDAAMTAAWFINRAVKALTDSVEASDG